MSDGEVIDGGPRLPDTVKEAMDDARNVTGAEFVPPTQFDDPDTATFGLWVGQDADHATLKTFEISTAQAEGLAEAFGRLADDMGADE